MLIKSEQLESDFVGVNKIGNELLRHMEKLKASLHNKIDIIHMLRMEAKDHSAQREQALDGVKIKANRHCNLNETLKEKEDNVMVEQDNARLLELELQKAKAHLR